MKRALIIFLLALIPTAAWGANQNFDLNTLIPAGSASASGRIIQLVAALTVLSVAPGLLVTVTSFTRFSIALSFLRAGLGLQSTPANLVMISLALFMTFYVMHPTFEESWNAGLKPLLENKIAEPEAVDKIIKPFRSFMVANVRDKDIRLFEDLTKNKVAIDASVEPDLYVLIPAFMISELRRGFEIGFLIVLPFLVIDLIISIVTMSMGMMMLPPTTISLPLKVLFFVLMDGWHLLVGSLVRSYPI
ncbi:flagellar type III secretion system pore protein FliP [Methylocystis sp. MJC1]|jgi:flagellar biosynthetic protein FliP|uniref:flagellar type III secretion system pore protein FliP n=1 Tax=Methylocystis sp. MJC1 TaxID=2654282 RepID=UPI0013EDB525|nr:flagellar type III secretion system pore protein FliP [Methylocystis sp. MJC1]KAF2990627.1 Flagellar biosynthetic protein FliP [Methylocystis sp. MJC1]MBU6525712.1 flagellar type III secretion system pore protein FliP [Methylocystis sp. MJC1]UZX12183.1 flagellar type III secretion system pore protein FliP [Methylocystis sp. MJC1]